MSSDLFSKLFMYIPNQLSDKQFIWIIGVLSVIVIPMLIIDIKSRFDVINKPINIDDFDNSNQLPPA